MTEANIATINKNSVFFLIDRKEKINDIVATMTDANSNSFINQKGRISNS